MFIETSTINISHVFKNENIYFKEYNPINIILVLVYLLF